MKVSRLFPNPVIKALAGLSEKISIVFLAGGFVPLFIKNYALSRLSLFCLSLTLISAGITLLLSYFIKETSNA